MLKLHVKACTVPSWECFLIAFFKTRVLNCSSFLSDEVAGQLAYLRRLPPIS